jgi:uncharacterized lipoprotein YmbA
MTGLRWACRGARPVAAALLLASCAGPPLTLYTLGTPGLALDAAPLGRRAVVIEVARVSLPDALDTEDILVRHGSVLRRSEQGRWASRLSAGITRLLVARLAQRRPDALVTAQPQTEAPAYRVLVNISRLDVTAEGTAALEADWQVVPRDPALPPRRDRGAFSATGAVATDRDVVALEGAVLDQLAARIGDAGLR